MREYKPSSQLPADYPTYLAHGKYRRQHGSTHPPRFPELTAGEIKFLKSIEPEDRNAKDQRAKVIQSFSRIAFEMMVDLPHGPKAGACLLSIRSAAGFASDALSVQNKE